MLRTAIFIAASLITFAGSAKPHDFSGSEAFSLTARAVKFGPRPSGSDAIEKLRGFIREELKSRNCEIISDKFMANTPEGSIAMENIIAKFAGTSGRAIAVTGHYDTKRLANFVGANDGGSSTGFLLELARTLQGRPRSDDVYLVFFDGEEAVREWTDTDSVYGSRHLAEKWTEDGTNRRLKAVINIDMIGDRNLKLFWDTGSSDSLRKLVWDAADSLGYARYFPREGGAIQDDHLPFVNAGVRALDMIDFESQGTFWHTPRDTMDKLDAHSFQVVGNVVVKAIEELEREK
ncbi:MAG TPA: M28 family peptidase [Bryobacteraceae bacterium]|nr:M28 family peptidase [Bryobacteraceae bacterium]